MDNRARELHEMLGKTVHIEVDRPIGYVHGDITYPVNYGYIPGTLAPDGEAEDAYILGVDHPVSAFTGRIIAVIHRRDDVEDKWVVAPEGTSFSEEQIRAAVHFQEQYFRSNIRLL